MSITSDPYSHVAPELAHEGEWANGRERNELVNELQRVGVPAAPSMSAKDLYEDRHVRQRGMWATVDHARMGPLEVLALPWLVNGARIEMVAAPTLGQHNDPVYRDLLGLSAEEQRALIAQGVAL